MTTTFSLDAKDPFTATGPGQRHAGYAALAAAGPVHRINLPTGEPAWLITGHDETRQALHDPRLIKSEQTLANIGHTEFHDWSSIMVTGVIAGSEVFTAASTAMVSFLRELIEIKRRDPADDLLSALVTVRNRADQLSEDELTSMAFLLLVAGHETTVNLIGNGVLALLTHPQQLALLQTQPERLGAAIEELLRFDGPLQVATLRLTTDSIDIGGVTIPAGELVSPACSPPTAIRRASPSPTRWTSPARTPRTLPSATASTTAWAPRWPGWKGASRWAACSPAFPGSAWPYRPRN